MGLGRRIAGIDMNDLRAIIDIGSNTVRLVIYGGPPRVPVVLHNEKVTSRLGKGLVPGGKLGGKAMRTALAALARYAVLLRLKGVTNVETVATAAVRDAGNGAAFLEQVAALGLSPRLLSGEEEAVASAQGVMAAFPGASGVVGDLGGGSLELTHIDHDQCEHGSTMPLGMLRMAELRAEGQAMFADSVEQELSAVDWSGRHTQPFYLVGGAWRALGRYAMKQQGWPIDDPHGFELSPEDALQLARTIGRGKLVSDGYGMSQSRFAGLPDAAALLGVLVQKLAPSRLVFSAWGLREGLLFRQLDKPAQGQDPLMAGVAAFCDRQGAAPAEAAMVTGWTAGASPIAGTGSQRLRLAISMLALASLRVEPNMRASQATDWSLRKRWLGIDAEGRAMMAAALIANTGRTQVPESLRLLASESALHEAVAWGLAIRLCRRFSGTTTHALACSALSQRDGQLVLQVRAPYHALCTDLVEKDLRVAAEWLGLVPVLQRVNANSEL